MASSRSSDIGIQLRSAPSAIPLTILPPPTKKKNCQTSPSRLIVSPSSGSVKRLQVVSLCLPLQEVSNVSKMSHCVSLFRKCQTSPSRLIVSPSSGSVKRLQVVSLCVSLFRNCQTSPSCLIASPSSGSVKRLQVFPACPTLQSVKRFHVILSRLSLSLSLSRNLHLKSSHCVSF